ncbi:hypothetical protein [Salinithrix halophila]|uniref:Uncharacterized protein n=1 Tax=Salinithrix halophila TaxID=1485204 RepID=A0ABV8JFR8_9BACL
MEKWVQLLVACVSLLRILMELPEAFFRWRERIRKQKKEKKRRKKRDLV